MSGSQTGVSSSHKIVVLGNSGVGKSSLINLISAKIGSVPSSTVGCAVTVVAHQYRAGSSEEQTELIELWDIGGSTVHRKASVVFLEGTSGAILVHDLSNKKSEENLSQWVALLHGDSSAPSFQRTSSSTNMRPLLTDIESAPIPILIVGCKLDLAPGRGKQSGYNRMNVDCRHPILPGSTNTVTISKFFDSVIERKKTPMAGERRRKVLFC